MFQSDYISTQHSSASVEELIMDTLKNENPSNIEGLTPLHEAAINGHVKICKIIIDTLVNRNPPDDNGITPLYLASKNGHFEFCRLIQCKRQTYTK